RRPALHTLHPRILGLVRQAPELLERKRLRLFDEPADLQAIRPRFDRRSRTVPHDPEAVLVRLVGGEKEALVVGGSEASGRTGHGGEELATIHRGSAAAVRGRSRLLDYAQWGDKGFHAYDVAPTSAAR